MTHPLVAWWPEKSTRARRVSRRALPVRRALASTRTRIRRHFVIMTARAPDRFEPLLSGRARIGWGVPVGTPRPAMNPLYEFGGGFPDPASFPYDGMVEATARVMQSEGAAAMTYGEPQGYRGRHELVELAHEYDTLILEDDAYGELRFEGETLPPLYALDRHGRVIRAGTLSKILGAGVRLGWLAAPREMIPAFQGFLFGGGVSPFMSRVATYFMRDHMTTHIQRLIDVYREKRDAMLRGLDEVLAGTGAVVSRPEGGFFLWMKLPAGTDQRRLADLAVDARVQYTPGPVFFPNGGGDELIRLAFSFEPPEKCYEGARLIARAIRAAGPR